MHRRALQLASLFLLLASMGTPAEAATHGAPAFAAPYVRILIAQQVAAHAAARSALVVRTQHEPVLVASIAESAYAGRAWTQPSPLRSAICVQAASGCGL